MTRTTAVEIVRHRLRLVKCERSDNEIEVVVELGRSAWRLDHAQAELMLRELAKMLGATVQTRGQLTK